MLNFKEEIYFKPCRKQKMQEYQKQHRQQKILKDIHMLQNAQKLEISINKLNSGYVYFVHTIGYTNL